MRPPQDPAPLGGQALAGEDLEEGEQLGAVLQVLDQVADLQGGYTLKKILNSIIGIYSQGPSISRR